MPIDLEKVSKGMAVSRGIEVAIELVMFYGILIAIAAYDMNRNAKKSKKQAAKLAAVEVE